MILLLPSCTSIRNYKKSDFYVKKDEYLRAHKIAFICGCINEGTNNSLNKFMIENKDVSLFSEAELISHYRVKEADSIGRIYFKKINPINYEDAGYGKAIFSNCIYYAYSKEVDKIARMSYKQIRKSK